VICHACDTVGAHHKPGCTWVAKRGAPTIHEDWPRVIKGSDHWVMFPQMLALLIKAGGEVFITTKELAQADGEIQMAEFADGVRLTVIR
jgi:hypothetical protein